MNLQIILAFGIYFSILLGFGILFYKQNKSAETYAMGGRSFNFWVTAIAAQSSDMGAWLFMAYPAMIYSLGALQLWTAVGLVIGMYLNWRLIAPRLRAQTEELQAVTIPTFLAKRFNDHSGLIVSISALVASFFFTCYISSGIVGLGRLFESAFDIPYLTGILAGISITLLYTLVGGFLAVSWSNLFQGLFLLAVILIVPIYGYFIVGGITTIKLAAASKGLSLSIMPSLQTLKDSLILFTSFGLGYFGQPHILINFMGIKDTSKLKNATIVGISWQIIVLLCAAAIGIIGIAYFPNGLENNEHLFVNMVRELFTPFLTGMALCGILAATLSTLNTQLLVASTGLSDDLYPTLTGRAASLRLSRIATVIIGTISLVISLNNSSSIYNLVQYSWAGLGSAFGPVIIAALYFKNINRFGAITGICVGALLAGLWPLLDCPIPTLIGAMGASFASMYLVSRITKSTPCN